MRENINLKTAWRLFVELRKELVELQKLRSQAVGFKITFVSASIGLIGANLTIIPTYVLALPAIAAVFFDLLIAGYSRSIKRIGIYLLEYIEPVIREESKWSDKSMLWHEFLTTRRVPKHLALISHLGITAIAAFIGLIVVWLPFVWYISFPISILIISLLIYDIIVAIPANRALSVKIDTVSPSMNKILDQNNL